MSNLSSPDLDELLSHAAWLQGLARRLCGDPHLAEDLAQGTMVAALAAPRSAPRSRQWVAGILRNLWRQYLRREGDRSEREAHAAPLPTLPSTAETVARLETQRRLAREVLSLREPERSAVLWHFFHDLSIRTIAGRLGVHADTVQKRIQRGLRSLRDRMTDSEEDRRALVALAMGLRPRLALPSLGALLVNTKPLIVGAAAVLIAALCWSLWPQDETAPDTVTERAEAASVNTTPAAPEVGTATERSDVTPPALPPAAVRARSVDGLLVDGIGRPLSGVALASGLDRAIATDGRFELRCAEDGDRVSVDDAAWVPMFDGVVGNAAESTQSMPIAVVAAHRVTVRGRVVDEDGNAMVGCAVSVLPPAGFLTAFSVPLDCSEPVWRQWQAVTNADGAFVLEDVGFVPGGTVGARAASFLPASAAIREAPAEIELVLRQPPVDADAVLGQVLDLFGMPVVGARVCLGPGRTRTDERGFFRLDRTRSKGHEQIWAMHRGLQPATVPVPDAKDGRPPFVELWLRTPTLSLAGRVLDASGNPVPGARVWVDGAESFRGGMWQVEAYLGGGATNSELRERPDRGELSLLELQEAHPTAFWCWTRTAADGSFKLTGLLPRYYSLGILAEEGMRRARTRPFAAGSAGVIVTFAPEVHSEVSGRIVGLDGSPRSGIAVEACCRVFRVQFDEDGSSRSAVRHGPVCKTDGDGRFRFPSLGSEGLFLALNGNAIVDCVIGMREGSLADAGRGLVNDLRIEVADRTHLQVALANPTLADRFHVVDAEDTVLQLANFEDGGMTVTDGSALRDGKSRVYAVAATAAFVVLLRDDAEVTRIPVQLVQGEVTIVRG